MAKAKKEPQEQAVLFPETEELAAILSKDSAQDIVVLVVPSHDRKDKALPEALAGE